MLSPHVYQLIDLALAEDLGSGDSTTDALFDGTELATAQLLAKSDVVICGQDVFDRVMRRVDRLIRVSWIFPDGAEVPRGTVIAQIAGPVASILKGERTGLNFLQRLSGIATKTRRYAEALAGTDTQITDTRKTLPGWRELDKFAVRAGGGRNHRMDLGGGVMIKDNHIAAAGSITGAIKTVRAVAPHTLRIECEVTNFDELREAVKAGADIILLDNMNNNDTAEAVDLARGLAGARPILLEASGGITLDRLRDLAETGVDLISSGALTHSVEAADISLDFTD
jgi:nicotinate-nucleotide pyrophosphorylase (carboxylating)